MRSLLVIAHESPEKVSEKRLITTKQAVVDNTSFPRFFKGASTLVLVVGVLALVVVTGAEGYNDEKGILKWNPYWFSNFRYSAPSSFYISPNRIGTPLKRFSDSMHSSGGSGGTGGIYKWSPVYFSGGSSVSYPASYYGGNGGIQSGGAGSMFSSNRPRWSLSSDYGGSRFLTRYYGGNSLIPMSQRSAVGSSPLRSSNSVIDLAGSNDLSALLGEEMSSGLGLDHDAIDIFAGDRPPTQ